jgi:hypothetical protein
MLENIYPLKKNQKNIEDESLFVGAVPYGDKEISRKDLITLH